MSVNLFTNYYRDANPERQKEIDKCLLANLHTKGLDAVYAITSEVRDAFASVTPDALDRLHIVGRDTRPTYQDFFSLINEKSGPDDINILANSDIHFDQEGLSYCKENLRGAEVYALTRWDVDEKGQVNRFLHPCSQDAWVFRGPVRQFRPINYRGKIIHEPDFCLGKPGCDNRIAWMLTFCAGYGVTNPQSKVKAYHLHATGVRRYTPAEQIPGPYWIPEAV